MTFESEEALCRAFAAAARADGWTAYPEPAGWDLLLVRRGVQVGVQAKLRGGVEVLLQALPPLTSIPFRRRARLARAGFPGPRYRAVLVGGFAGRTEGARRGRRAALYALAAYVGVAVLEPPENPGDRRWLRLGYRLNLCRRGRIGWREPLRLDVRAYRWFPSKPVWTPPFVPDLPAGVPSPSRIGPWQLAACALELIEGERGWVSLADARDVSARFGGTWNPSTPLSRYYRCTGEPVEAGSRARRWVHRPRVRRASADWPEVVAHLTRVKPGEGGSE